MKASFLAAFTAAVIFLTSCFIYTDAILILILMNVLYLQNVVLSIKKGLKGQNTLCQIPNNQ